MFFKQLFFFADMGIKVKYSTLFILYKTSTYNSEHYFMHL